MEEGVFGVFSLPWEEPKRVKLDCIVFGFSFDDYICLRKRCSVLCLEVKLYGRRSFLVLDLGAEAGVVNLVKRSFFVVRLAVFSVKNVSFCS